MVELQKCIKGRELWDRAVCYAVCVMAIRNEGIGVEWLRLMGLGSDTGSLVAVGKTLYSVWNGKLTPLVSS